MRKTALVIAAIAASTCLFAADAPLRISPEFAKAGLKALITVKNAPNPRADRVQSAMDDAETVASTAGDNAAFIEIFRLRSSLKFDAEIPGAKTVEKEACSNAIAKMLRSGKAPSLPLDNHGWFENGLPECQPPK